MLVPNTALEMFELVDRCEHYPAFLPWCGGAEVLADNPPHKTARLHIDYHGVRANFTTDNVNTPPESIVITLRDGPFRHLHGNWQFRSLSEEACKIEFEMAWEFATPLLERAVGPVFNRIASTFIDAFVRRAEVVYGRRM